jgi:hypothetical protein
MRVNGGWFFGSPAIRGDCAAARNEDAVLGRKKEIASAIVIARTGSANLMLIVCSSADEVVIWRR